jgi:hypothetical protein
MVQVRDELDNRGQPNSVERTLQLNHVPDAAEASLYKSEDWPTPRLRVSNAC